VAALYQAQAAVEKVVKGLMIHKLVRVVHQPRLVENHQSVYQEWMYLVGA
jgi:hypothetical protein